MRITSEKRGDRLAMSMSQSNTDAHSHCLSRLYRCCCRRKELPAARVSGSCASAP